MGVPALFRWLSKKYPKIILPVIEEDERTVEDQDGTEVVLPTDMSGPNPNGVEFDNLYLDMNGIVHPCTHPEGKAAPETEEEMMVEVFKYTERVVNMVRPRKLLMMAIDGVAPRAKMNQQRSRRFRSAQEAKEKEEERMEALLLWESMGQPVTDEMRSKKAWDSNAITPGTPFMDLLAQSLRYWVVQKMNTDPGWKDIEVIISDASVPGEGEHKIMDFIRRQRTNPGHDPNTQHVIYGLDADLIMLSLATHEPSFRVLREDVFFQDTSPTACRLCGQEGHYAAQCTGQAKVKADEHDTKKSPAKRKPFIFLDVSILREYLEIELNITQAPFPFDFERAIDDWVLLIFFVGNDFLPHLPSLEIREGAIDTLLKIWKDELPRMGGYLTNNGKLEYQRVEIILEGLARREDEIFRRRREAEERQDQNAKRRKIEASYRSNNATANINGETMIAIRTSSTVSASSPSGSVVHGLPPRPNFDTFEGNANTLGFGAPAASSEASPSSAIAGITGSDKDWVANRRAIRMANMSAAEMLKAEMMSAMPVKQKPDGKKKQLQNSAEEDASEIPTSTTTAAEAQVYAKQEASDAVMTEMGIVQEVVRNGETSEAIEQPTSVTSALEESNQLDVPVSDPESIALDNEPEAVAGVKRKADEVEEGNDQDAIFEPDDEDEDAPGDTSVVVPTRKVNPDGTVEQEDTVKLWEPGYRERYYRQKFGVELSDAEFRKKVTTSYVEGMAWVLHYYFQGTPSWQWFYPFHFAPFAADFEEVAKMNISFEIGHPFKPFEQLMGVFPASSRKHIPKIFHSLMTDPDSPILDFYPESFEIDMNGKKMAWQGVALLPFIDQKRLLDAMDTKYDGLNEDELRRNQWGSNVMFVADEHTLYPFMEALYGKRKNNDRVVIDPKISKGLNGSLLPDPSCIPGSTYECPLADQGLPDIQGDRSISALYFFPKQLQPHRSMLLPGVKRPQRVLSQADIEHAHRGGARGRGGGYSGSGYNNGRDSGRNTPHGSQQSRGGSYSNGYYVDRGPPNRGRGDYGRGVYGGAVPQRPYQPTPMGENGRPSNHSYQSNSYDRDQPSYYGGRGNDYPRPSSHSQGHNSGYGSASRGSYGGYGNDRGGGNNRAGYGNDRSGGYSSRGGYAGYGGDPGHGAGGYPAYGRGSSNGYVSQGSSGGGYGGGGYGGYSGGGSAGGGYNQSQQAGYGGYGGYGQPSRGGPPPSSSSYSGRGRGYGRY